MKEPAEQIDYSQFNTGDLWIIARNGNTKEVRVEAQLKILKESDDKSNYLDLARNGTTIEIRLKALGLLEKHPELATDNLVLLARIGTGMLGSPDEISTGAWKILKSHPKLNFDALYKVAHEGKTEDIRTQAQKMFLTLPSITMNNLQHLLECFWITPVVKDCIWEILANPKYELLKELIT